MAKEIERRFKVYSDKIPFEIFENEPISIRQGYFDVNGAAIRIRQTSVRGHTFGYMTTKFSKSSGINDEFEYEIPVCDVEAMMAKVPFIVEKTRIEFSMDEKHVGELDIFGGMAIVEVEVEHLDSPIHIPEWFGPEITHVKGLSNYDIARDYRLAKSIFDSVK